MTVKWKTKNYLLICSVFHLFQVIVPLKPVFSTSLLPPVSKPEPVYFKISRVHWQIIGLVFSLCLLKPSLYFFYLDSHLCSACSGGSSLFWLNTWNIVFTIPESTYVSLISNIIIILRLKAVHLFEIPEFVLMCSSPTCYSSLLFSSLLFSSLLFSSLLSFHSPPLSISPIHAEVNMEGNKLWSCATSRHQGKWERAGKTARNAGEMKREWGRDLLLNVSVQLSSEFYANFWKVPESEM